MKLAKYLNKTWIILAISIDGFWCVLYIPSYFQIYYLTDFTCKGIRITSWFLFLSRFRSVSLSYNDTPNILKGQKAWMLHLQYVWPFPYKRSFVIIKHFARIFSHLSHICIECDTSKAREREKQRDGERFQVKQRNMKIKWQSLRLQHFERFPIYSRNAKIWLQLKVIFFDRRRIVMWKYIEIHPFFFLNTRKGKRTAHSENEIDWFE